VKNAVDSEDFLIKLEVAVKTSEKEIIQKRLLERESNIIEIGRGRGYRYFFMNDEIFDIEQEYISDNTLNLIINVRAANKPSLGSLFKSYHFSSLSFISTAHQHVTIPSTHSLK
jgi:hypothetical protein